MYSSMYRKMVLMIAGVALCVLSSCRDGSSPASPQAQAEVRLDSAVLLIDRGEYSEAMLQLKRAEELLP